MSRLSGIWHNRGIRVQVLLPWVSLLFLVILLSGYWVYRQRQLEDDRQHARLHRQGALIAKSMQANAMKRWADVLTYWLKPDPLLAHRVRDSEAEMQTQIQQLRTLFQKSSRCSAFIKVGEEDSYLQNFTVTRAGLMDLYLGLLQAVDDRDVGRQRQYLDLLDPKLELNFATLDDLAAYHVKVEQLSEQLLRKAEERQLLVLLIPLLGLLLAGLGLAVFQTHVIANPLLALTAFAERVEFGKEAKFIKFAGMREIDKLSQALGRMVDSLRRANQDLAVKQEELSRAYASVEAQVQERTAQLRQRSSELETANKDLENFSYSVSHDLRAPLRAIDGFVAILTEEQEDRLDEEGKRMFGIVAENARKMGGLIDDILAFSRAGRFQLERVETDMRALVDEVWASLTTLGDGHAIEFRVGDLPRVGCDPRAIRQVWQNLFANAIKFSRERDPAIIEVGAEPDGDFVRFWVTDNGVGFNNDYTGKLFVLFQRLHGMDEFEGTGVGLAIVKRFVQKHGGEILAEGVPGHGAKFSFTLPKSELEFSVTST
jgi:signal transduction histidine kinase